MNDFPAPMAMNVEAIASAVQDGDLSAREVTLAALARIAAIEPHVRAFLGVESAAALRDADDIDERRRRGQRLGRLAGVPIARKDNLSLTGRATTCASRILEGYVSPLTATAIERLRAEDAIFVGRTNMDEFAMGSSCENSAFQTTANPWDLSRVPGGSSGGSAAAVAAGAVPLALGSDTGGSIRQPAALCGVVGLKPSYGRISRYGLVAFGSSLDQIGPISRDVRGAALALEVMSGVDARDSTSSTNVPPSILESIESGIAGLRIGLLREIPEDGLDEPTRRAWSDARSRLERLGAELVDISVPNLPAAIAIYYVIANSEASANLSRFDGIRFGLRVGSGGLEEIYSATRTEGFGSEVKRRIILGTFALSAGYYDAYYGRAQGSRRALRAQFSRAFADVDLIATPTTPGGAFALGERTSDPLAMYLSDIFTTPANLAGLPAIAIPCGLDDTGMPLSLQLMAAPFAEAGLLRAARAFERDFPWSFAPVLPGVNPAA
ncbi:MAG: Asp-tRNA(Asn)/Glu-tRNA(Gln) amidotransferase subunit GatA [Thermoanaerobaculia bacterium]